MLNLNGIPRGNEHIARQPTSSKNPGASFVSNPNTFAIVEGGSVHLQLESPMELAARYVVVG